MSKKMMQLKVARKRRKNSPLEEFLSYMCCKLLTCQRFPFCSSSVVCTTLTWEQLALCCSGTIVLWRVGTSPVLWWVNTAGTAYCVCTHECACVPIHSTHILYPPLMHLHLVHTHTHTKHTSMLQNCVLLTIFLYLQAFCVSVCYRQTNIVWCAFTAGTVFLRCVIGGEGRRGEVVFSLGCTLVPLTGI